MIYVQLDTIEFLSNFMSFSCNKDVFYLYFSCHFVCMCESGREVITGLTSHTFITRYGSCHNQEFNPRPTEHNPSFVMEPTFNFHQKFN